MRNQLHVVSLFLCVAPLASCKMFSNNSDTVPTSSGTTEKIVSTAHTLLVGDNALACEVKPNVELKVVDLGELPKSFQGASLDAEVRYVKIESDLKQLHSAGLVFRVDGPENAIQCDLSKVLYFKSDFKAGNTPVATNPTSAPSSGSGSSTGSTSSSVSTGTSTTPTTPGSLAKGEAFFTNVVVTYFKQSELDSTQLSTSQKCEIAPGSKVHVTFNSGSRAGLMQVTLMSNLPTSARGSYCSKGSKGFLFAADFVDGKFEGMSSKQTVFKEATVDSSSLSADKKCTFNGAISGVLVATDDTPGIGYHLKIKTNAPISSAVAQSSFCEAQKNGFLFLEHFYK